MTAYRLLTAAEAAELERLMPAGLTEPMRELALCLFTVLARRDERCGQGAPDADWQAALRGLAQLALEQLQYLSGHMGGGGFYLAKGVAAMLAARDELIWREFNGRNYAELARAHGLTEMRVRQISGRAAGARHGAAPGPAAWAGQPRLSVRR